MNNREYYAGGLMMLIGLGAASIGRGYDVGSLTQMGPGFFPVALGLALAAVGVLIAVMAKRQPAASIPDAQGAIGLPDLRGAIGIIGGLVAFILLAERAGLAPAAFACVFIAALGDREASWKSALLLSAAVTVFGVLLFCVVLKINLPLLAGWST